jgi:hypothetical protein
VPTLHMRMPKPLNPSRRTTGSKPGRGRELAPSAPAHDDGHLGHHDDHLGHHDGPRMTLDEALEQIIVRGGSGMR